ncbi:hypothetical protein CEXT_738811 [Caerostris extrusa]|uniref:Uncharacterized protein n=1 Tax=Caerostris extrusa TaxID=172846 RepID=A0AAV4QHR6_CAEEX|nr:hypothetical protein CEXT_738811 [Caerostris extrusa]
MACFNSKAHQWGVTGAVHAGLIIFIMFIGRHRVLWADFIDFLFDMTLSQCDICSSRQNGAAVAKIFSYQWSWAIVQAHINRLIHQQLQR